MGLLSLMGFVYSSLEHDEANTANVLDNLGDTFDNPGTDNGESGEASSFWRKGKEDIGDNDNKLLGSQNSGSNA